MQSIFDNYLTQIWNLVENEIFQHFELLIEIQTPIPKIPTLAAKGVQKVDRHRKKRAAQGATLYEKLI
jgi:hypothetical protein